MVETSSLAQTPANANELCGDLDGATEFPDVSSRDYGADYILCARAVGLTKGKNDWTFIVCLQNIILMLSYESPMLFVIPGHR